MRHAQSYFTARVRRLLPLPLSSLQLNKPVPVDLWNSRGTLLLSKYQVIETQSQLEQLSGLHPLIEDAQFIEILLGSADPAEVMAGPDPDPVAGWPALHRRLHQLLRAELPMGELQGRLAVLLAALRKMLAAERDKSLFMLVQMLYDSNQQYSASHALACAALCQLLGADAGLETWDIDSLGLAALTMNIAMSDLQDQLARQVLPADAIQRDLLQAHPAAGAQLLASHGITDVLWLQLVREHHDARLDEGPPSQEPAQIAQRLLWIADQYVAQISPRETRAGIAPNRAARKLYVDLRQRDAALGNLLVRALGIYPPGSYVRLQSGEMAVVIGRGDAAHQPRVVSLVRPDGVQLHHPTARDTRVYPYMIAESVVVAGHIVLRINPARLFRST
jgi:HD-GYP domain-containing protein (c-di-GMP phosphodiesterase class II)